MASIDEIQSDKVKEAADALADLFQVDDDDDDEEPEDIIPKIINEPVAENNLIEDMNGLFNTTNTTKRISPKISPVDLYGCDEMTPKLPMTTTPENPTSTKKQAPKPQISNSNPNTPVATNNVKFQLAGDIPTQTPDQVKKINNDITSPNINYAQFPSQTGININENLLAQIMSNGTNNGANGAQQSNYSNVNYLMRRERSLDRGPATENFIENFLQAPNVNGNTRRSYNGTNRDGNNYANLGNPNQSPNSLYVANLYSNTTQNNPNQINPNNQHQSKRQVNHHRSNSILNNSSNSNNFQRDYGNGILINNGLRSSARALSSTSFSTQNFQRDPSATSLKSLGCHGSNGNLNEGHQINNQVNGQQNNGGGSSTSKLNFIKDLQIRLMDMQKECYYLRCELDSSQQKLTSSMQSIKQFWSPELKRERHQRKEEATKYSLLLEQYKILQSQYQTLLDNYEQQALANQHLQHQIQYGDQNNGQSPEHASKQMQREKSLMKKTVNELEMRIATQKQSLCTKDETIKKLFHLVKSASNKIKSNDIFSTNDTMNDIEALTSQLEASNANNLVTSERLQEEERKCEQFKQMIQQMKLQKSTSSIYETHQETSQLKQLEAQVKHLQEELKSVRTDDQNSAPQHLNLANKPGSFTSANSLHSNSQLDLLRANEKFMKEKLESYKFDLSRKETELQQVRTKLETCESKEKDLNHYLNLLKESISTKDQQITMQQSEISDCRTRIRDKEGFIEKKNQHLQAIQLEKHQRDSDIGELRDQMDIKERKISVLNRKIENLEEQLKDKEMQITTIRGKLSTSTVGSGSMYHANLMKTLDQKEKIIEKLTREVNKQQEQEMEKVNSVDNSQQVELLNGSIKEMSEKLEASKTEIETLQNEIYDLKDDAEMLKTQMLRKDSHVNSLELSLTQKNEEIDMIEEKMTRISKQQQQQMALATSTASQQINGNQLEIDNLKKQLGYLQKEIVNKEAVAKNLVNELNALKEIIDEFDGQKQMVKSKLEQQQGQFKELERHFEEVTGKLELELKEARGVNAELVTKLEKEKTDLDLGASEVKVVDGELEEKVVKSGQRVAELEEALRESVAITAEREFVFGQHKKKNEAIEEDNKMLQEEINSMQRSLYEQQCEFNRYQEELGKREEQLVRLEEEKVEEMNQLLVTKQELLLSSISEKDAQIGSLECDRNSDNTNRINQLNEEKDYLHQQLKELSEKRMKLMQEHMTARDAKEKVKLLSNVLSAHDVDGITG